MARPKTGTAGGVAAVGRDALEGDRSRERFHLGHLRRLAPAGWLDIDSTGLLVLTQDGRAAKALIGDDSDVEKEYLGGLPRTWPVLPDDQLERLRHGLNSTA